MTEAVHHASRRIGVLVAQLFPRKQVPARAEAAEDEPDQYIRMAEEDRREKEYLEAGVLKESAQTAGDGSRFVPHLIVPSFVEEAVKSVRIFGLCLRKRYSYGPYRVKRCWQGDESVCPSRSM
jgi:hypothetical protein